MYFGAFKPNQPVSVHIFTLELLTYLLVDKETN